MADLPRGTVTFLFTDIEGSTALWERDRTAMASAVARHITLLDAAIQAHDGIHFKTIGDAVQAVFSTASRAVAAAVDGQRTLLAEDWGELGPLKVRMALHAGEAVPRDGDYLAAPLNRISRLLSTGSGGQILVSQAVQQLTRGALAPKVELSDLGEHRLRDLLEPERVFQLVHPDLPNTFPPLKSLESHPHNLPRQPTPFVGREREVGEVVALLRRDDVQLLTLTGPGGTGKTRLALQAAAELLEDSPDGVFFISLAPVTNPDQLVSAIAGALGMRQEGVQLLPEQLRDFLRAKQLLLVLDNFEHLSEAAPVVGELLSTAPGLKVLVTSRAPLHLRAEHEFEVPPLSLPDLETLPPLNRLAEVEAVALFVQRAQALQSDFALDSKNARAVAEICIRLDGLPLAIELAAARTKLLPPVMLLARLDRRLSVLTGGARDLPARQRTLRDTIAWSHDLLEPGEQTLFRNLGVFSGGWTLEAAETVGRLDSAVDVLNGLASLVDNSLVRQSERVNGQPRYTMLETIREFASEQLAASGAEDAVHSFHAAFFVDLAECADREFFGPQEISWLDWCTAEVANLRAALEWSTGPGGDPGLGLRLSAALWWFWLRRGSLREGQAWLERGLALGRGAPPEVRARALAVAGELANFQANYAQASAWLEESLALYATITDPMGLARAQLFLGDSHMDRGEVEASIPPLEAALAGFQQLNARAWAGCTLYYLAVAASRMHDSARAQVLADEALDVCRQSGFRSGMAMTLGRLGTQAFQEGDYEAAEQHVREALTLRFTLDDRYGMANQLTELAQVAAARGEPERAARLDGVASALRHAIGATIPQAQRADYDQFIGGLRDTLGCDRFERAWLADHGQTSEEAVATARAIIQEALAASASAE